MSKKSARDIKLEAIREACVQLRSDGITSISISSVNDITKITRNTLRKPPYCDLIASFSCEDTDDGTITGGALQRSKLLRLAERVAVCEKSVESLISGAKKIEESLVSELMVCFKKISRTPNDRLKTENAFSEINEKNKIIEDLQAELAGLRNEAADPDKVAAFAPKVKHYVIPDNTNLGDIGYDKLCDMHESAIKMAIDSELAKSTMPVMICFVSGIPFSGKSYWANNHRTPVIGRTVYIEGPFHTERIRRIGIREVRNAFPRTLVTCASVIADREACETISTTKGMNNGFFKLIAENYAAVTLDEDFDFIFPVRRTGV